MADPRETGEHHTYLIGERFAAVQAALRERARRRDYLRSEILTEPGWDILLELYAFELLHQPVTEPELCARINVPSTTSVRWMKVLETDNLINRRLDPEDRSVVWVALTSKGSWVMDGYFSGVG
jgi:DNA-binding MarR family transcriptional regulator